MSTCTWIIVLPVIITALGAIQLRFASATANDSTSGNKNGDDERENYPMKKDLVLAYIEKPPYLTSGTNESLGGHGMLSDVLLRYTTDLECSIYGRVTHLVEPVRADSEFHMIELLRQNKVHVAAPIFEPTERRYNEFLFFKVTDYPGSEFITSEDETKTLSLFLDAVLKSWPLFAVTLILTAIAGVIIWALDSYWNSEQFPRSFIKGSWDGFWWSFISVTTVGYGDKAPKSIVARIFSIIWILSGVIIMGIFTANITSALTTLSMQQEPTNLVDVKVAVLANGTEYQHALEENAIPTEYPRIDDVIKAVELKEVDGMLLDRFTASYYQSRGKLKSLITVKTFKLRRNVGILISKDRSYLETCLKYLHLPEILKSVQTVTATYKLAEQKPPRIANLFKQSSFIKPFMYGSLGVLAGLLLIGTLWDIIRKRRRINQITALGTAVKEEMTAVTIHNDIEAAEVARQLLQQMQEQFDKLEFKISK